MTLLGTNQITIMDDGTSTLYNTTGATYFVGTTAGVVGNLAVGERVSLELSTTTPLQTPPLVTKVTIWPARVFGSVTAVAGNVITVAGFHSTTWTVTVSGTTTYTSGGAASTLAAVVVGTKIFAIGLPGTAANSLNANSVNIWTPPVRTHARGVVSALGTNSITITDDGTPTTYTTTSTTTYFEGSTAGVVGDLAVGQKVSLQLTTTTPQTVTKVTICLQHVFGAVTAVAGNVITVAGFHNTTWTVTVSGTTTYTSGGAASTLAAVVVGSKIDAIGLPGTAANTLNANSVNIFVGWGHGEGGGDGFGHGHGHGHSHSRH